MTEETGFAGEVRTFSRSVPEGWVGWADTSGYARVLAAADALADAVESDAEWGNTWQIKESLAAYRKARGEALTFDEADARFARGDA